MGEVPRYTGIGNCFSRVHSEQGMGAFWRGNLTNCIRYFPTQAFNLAFKDSIKAQFPKYSPKKEFAQFFAVNMASGGLAGAGSLCIVYPLDYARTRLASDVGSGKKTFSGLGDCLMKTAKGPKGALSLYNGFGISVAGIIPYRGVQFGLNDTLTGINPYAKEVSLIGMASKWGCAQFSVIMSGFVTYPFDTVRRRLQMESDKPMDAVSTKELPTASKRSLLMKVCLPSSRVPVPMSSVALVLHLCLCCTVRPRTTCTNKRLLLSIFSTKPQYTMFVS